MFFGTLNPEPVTEYILHITVSGKVVDALADLYRFTPEDHGTFCTSCYPRKCAPACLLCAAGLLLLMASCAGRCRGTLAVSCTSGKWTPSAMPGVGTDIATPEGAPILAAHSGTVLVSGWNNSCGNQKINLGFFVRFSRKSFRQHAGAALTAPAKDLQPLQIHARPLVGFRQIVADGPRKRRGCNDQKYRHPQQIVRRTGGVGALRFWHSAAACNRG